MTVSKTVNPTKQRFVKPRTAIQNPNSASPRVAKRTVKKKITPDHKKVVVVKAEPVVTKVETVAAKPVLAPVIPINTAVAQTKPAVTNHNEGIFVAP